MPKEDKPYIEPRTAAFLFDMGFSVAAELIMAEDLPDDSGFDEALNSFSDAVKGKHFKSRGKLLEFLTEYADQNGITIKSGIPINTFELELMANRLWNKS